jgi:hypothetical protein
MGIGAEVNLRLRDVLNRRTIDLRFSRKRQTRQGAAHQSGVLPWCCLGSTLSATLVCTGGHKSSMAEGARSERERPSPAEPANGRILDGSSDRMQLHTPNFMCELLKCIPVSGGNVKLALQSAAQSGFFSAPLQGAFREAFRPVLERGLMGKPLN